MGSVTELVYLLLYLWCDGAACCGAKPVWRNDKEAQVVVKGHLFFKCLCEIIYENIYEGKMVKAPGKYRLRQMWC